MPPSVAIVTDSTACLDPEETDRYGIVVIPLQVLAGGRTMDDVVLREGDLAARLREWSPITTSRPSPEAFRRAYEEAAGRGASGVLSIHLSAELSGTVDSARLAAADPPIPVEVLDSRSLGMGLGFPVLAAAAAAAHGAPLTETAEAARRCMGSVHCYFYLDTLEYLRRGGRIGAAASLVGSALAIKPLLHISNGAIAPLEKVRTATRALARLEDLAVQAAAEDPVDVAIQHLAALPRAEDLAERLTKRIPRLNRLRLTETDLVIAAHTGPGMLGVTIAPPHPSAD
ncbi:DegV family protein [Thermopolyspora sp. NPDC052614]|uniref:DegV family protein n=1 Tax=Thermopolyspora sp. NPDC052614 TaxID=3155682 RepID=UPI00344A2484